jgi:hypothetical protein
MIHGVVNLYRGLTTRLERTDERLFVYRSGQSATAQSARYALVDFGRGSSLNLFVSTEISKASVAAGRRYNLPVM